MRWSSQACTQWSRLYVFHAHGRCTHLDDNVAGDSNDSYVKWMCNAANVLSWRSVAFNYRYSMSMRWPAPSSHPAGHLGIPALGICFSLCAFAMPSMIKQCLAHQHNRPQVVSQLCATPPLSVSREHTGGVVHDHRGCGGAVVLTSCRPFHQPIETRDIHAAVKVLRQTFPKAPIFAVGFSLGAYTLNKYVGEVDSGIFPPGGSSVMLCVLASSMGTRLLHIPFCHWLIDIHTTT